MSKGSFMSNGYSQSITNNDVHFDSQFNNIDIKSPDKNEIRKNNRLVTSGLDDIPSIGGRTRASAAAEVTNQNIPFVGL